jgi:hypothetical protein
MGAGPSTCAMQVTRYAAQVTCPTEPRTTNMRARKRTRPHHLLRAGSSRSRMAASRNRGCGPAAKLKGVRLRESPQGCTCRGRGEFTSACLAPSDRYFGSVGPASAYGPLSCWPGRVAQRDGLSFPATSSSWNTCGVTPYFKCGISWIKRQNPCEHQRCGRLSGGYSPRFQTNAPRP